MSAECVDEIKEREKEIDLKFAELEGRDWDEYDNLLRILKIARGIDKDAYFSLEGGKHFLVDFDLIDKLHEALKKVEHLS
jgi:hypothetical protein